MNGVDQFATTPPWGDARLGGSGVFTTARYRPARAAPVVNALFNAVSRAVSSSMPTSGTGWPTTPRQCRRTPGSEGRANANVDNNSGAASSRAPSAVAPAGRRSVRHQQPPRRGRRRRQQRVTREMKPATSDTPAAHAGAAGGGRRPLQPGRLPGARRCSAGRTATTTPTAYGPARRCSKDSTTSAVNADTMIKLTNPTVIRGGVPGRPGEGVRREPGRGRRAFPQPCTEKGDN